jgi:hypothetical protein
MKKTFTLAITGFILLCFYSQRADCQSTISGHVYSDINKNGVYDSGEGLSQVGVWLLSRAAVSPFYQIYPVQTANTQADGSYIFNNVGFGDFLVRVQKSSMNGGIILNANSNITQVISDNNPWNSDRDPNGITDISILNGNYDNVDFGFATNNNTPTSNTSRLFSFDNGANSFVNVMSKTFDLATENCGGNTFNPTLTISTDNQNNATANTYPMAGCISCFPGMYWPGQNKGGFHADDATFQMFFDLPPYSSAIDASKATVTLEFSNTMSAVHFTLYDIDAINPQLVNGSVDHVRVTGYLGNSPVMPVIVAAQLHPYVSIYDNTISGWPEYPDNNAINNYPDNYNSDDADNGNAEVYFNTLVDKIVIEYEEYESKMISSAKKIAVAASPINNESQWDQSMGSTVRGISFGSIGYTFFCSVLAADELKFDATASGQKVNLQWSKSVESDLKQYRIERLSPAGSWKSLGTATAKGSNQVYRFTDLQPNKGVNQYRLVMMGNNGSLQLSEIRKVNIASGNDAQIVNNPASKLNVMLYGDAKNVAVYEGSGKLVIDYPIARSANSGMLVSLNKFIQYTGLYYVKVSFGNGETKTLKYLKSR